MLGEEGVECVENTCDEGEVVWTDGDCYPYNTIRNLQDWQVDLTKEEREYLAVEETPVPLCVGTFCNCKEMDRYGKCLERVNLPMVEEKKAEDFLRLLTEEFPDILK